ncbi:MAG: sulfur oxidation c-type cytochrome SoxA, partial [Candidatus Binatia bacterium]
MCKLRAPVKNRVARFPSLDARFHGHDVIFAQAGIQGFAPIWDMSQFFPLILVIGALLSFTETGPLAAENVTPYVVADRRSGYTYLSPENQQLQNDAFANPGQLWVEKGQELWQEPKGSTHVSCASCHGEAIKSMRGVRARYPRFDAQSKKLINLELQINRCHEERQHSMPYPYESEALLALTTFIGFHSRGLPVDVRIDGPAQPFFAAGRAFFLRRRGQLDLACTHCHDE